jgi:prefoldin subunit 5
VSNDDEWRELERKSERLKSEIERLTREQEAILREMAKLDEEAERRRNKSRGSG